MEAHVVVSAFVVERGLKMVVLHIAYEIREIVESKRTVLIQQLRIEALIVAHARLQWLNCNRNDQVRWLDYLTFPTMLREPLRILSIIVLEMKLEKAVHERKFEKRFAGVRSLLDCLSSKVPSKGTTNSVTSTLWDK